MKVSYLFGKKVESAAGKEGYVIAVYADGNMLDRIICADENEKQFAVSANAVKNVRDKLVYKSSEKVQKYGTRLTLGKPVFDCGGVYLGKLTDLTVEKNRIIYANVGNKKFSFDDIVLGDAVIIKNSARVLKSDVTKGGKVLIRRGTPLSPEVLQKAQQKGEYVQTNLKTI